MCADIGIATLERIALSYGIQVELGGNLEGGYPPSAATTQEAMRAGARVACAKLAPVKEKMHDSAMVRVATKDDFEAVLDILAEVAAEDQWIATEIPFDPAPRRSSMLQTLERPDAQLFVAMVAGELIGHLGISARRPGLLEFGMVVAARWRGRGVGNALLSACIAWAREIGAHKIMLEVFPQNTTARALYGKYGFVEEGYFRRHLRRKNGELWDSIPMSLLLEDRSELTDKGDRDAG